MRGVQLDDAPVSAVGHEEQLGRVDGSVVAPEDEGGRDPLPGGCGGLLASMNEGWLSSPSPVRGQNPDALVVDRRVSAGRVKRLSKCTEVNGRADGA